VVEVDSLYLLGGKVITYTKPSSYLYRKVKRSLDWAASNGIGSSWCDSLAFLHINM